MSGIVSPALASAAGEEAHCAARASYSMEPRALNATPRGADAARRLALRVRCRGERFRGTRHLAGRWNAEALPPAATVMVY